VRARSERTGEGCGRTRVGGARTPSTNILRSRTEWVITPPSARVVTLDASALPLLSCPSRTGRGKMRVKVSPLRVLQPFPGPLGGQVQGQTELCILETATLGRGRRRPSEPEAVVPPAQVTFAHVCHKLGRNVRGDKPACSACSTLRTDRCRQSFPPWERALAWERAEKALS